MNTNLLVIDSSARVTRSVTRRLTQRFASAWKARHADAAIVFRDLGQAPPPALDERWIASAFTASEDRDEAMNGSLAASEELIGEIEHAGLIVFGVPLYNFGMPGLLKSWFDQIIRVGRTIHIDAELENPYVPLLDPKPVVVVTSAGSSAFQPGGEAESLNFLDPHLSTLLGFLGFGEPQFIRVGNAEFKDEAYHRSLAEAEGSIDRITASFDLP